MLKERVHATGALTFDPVRAFIQDRRAAGLKPYTVAVYLRCISDLAEFLAREYSINDLFGAQNEHLRNYFIHLRLGHNCGGVEVYYRAIRAFYLWSWEEFELEGRCPIARVRVEHAKPKPRPGIPLQYVEAMVLSCSTRLSLRDKAILYGLLDTCARATEFCQLRLRDVDLATGRTYIRDSKSGRSRTVRFGRKALRALRRYLFTRGPRPEDPLFAAENGSPLDRFALRSVIDRRAYDAALPQLYGLHDFRRRGGYELWRRTRDLEAVSLYLGHSSTVVTRQYLALSDEDIMETHMAGSPVDWMGVV
jgi:integrase